MYLLPRRGAEKMRTLPLRPSVSTPTHRSATAKTGAGRSTALALSSATAAIFAIIVALTAFVVPIGSSIAAVFSISPAIPSMSLCASRSCPLSPESQCHGVAPVNLPTAGVSGSVGGAATLNSDERLFRRQPHVWRGRGRGQIFFDWLRVEDDAPVRVQLKSEYAKSNLRIAWTDEEALKRALDRIKNEHLGEALQAPPLPGRDYRVYTLK
jgi:hypothetical protein